jgi:excisionase family DNA binding protein
VAGDGERENLHRSARALPATRRHAGHISRCHDTQATASLHDFAVSLIARRIKSGEITAVRVGTHYRIPAREFERFRDAVMGAMISDVSADLEADLYGQ